MEHIIGKIESTNMSYLGLFNNKFKIRFSESFAQSRNGIDSSSTTGGESPQRSLGRSNIDCGAAGIAV